MLQIFVHGYIYSQVYMYIGVVSGCDVMLVIFIYIGLTVGNPKARLPYSKVDVYGISVEGLPNGKTLKHPSSYGQATLKEILASKHSIKLTGN